jgi:hypothetical protein
MQGVGAMVVATVVVGVGVAVSGFQQGAHKVARPWPVLLLL